MGYKILERSFEKPGRKTIALAGETMSVMHHKILIVDDNESMLNALDYVLENAGFKVYRSANGQQALQLLELHAIDLIISDIEMPVMDGIELCRQTRIKPAYAKTPFIFLTANSDQEQKLKGIIAGADEYIVKPLKMEELISRVKLLCDKGYADKEQRRKDEYFSIIGEMASWVAHEIRNPIFAISSSAEILRENLPDKSFDKFLAAIINEIRQLNTMIDNLLLFAKPVHLDLQQAPISLVVGQIVEILESSPEARQCRVVLQCEERIDVVAEIDPDKIQQVFLNIVKNSIEAHATEINIKVTHTDSHHVAMVTDNGSGIPQAVMANLFNPFITTSKRGAGLGLPISRKIIEAHGGSITVSSDISQGSTVEIRLPITANHSL
jgi:signal transduction histidine kinase